MRVAHLMIAKCIVFCDIGIDMFLLLLLTLVAGKQQDDPASNQLVDFKEKTKGPIGILTTTSGAPVGYKDTCSLNSNLLDNEWVMESLADLVRERIPERFTHAKGAGALGYFETTHDVSNICKAKMFDGIGKRTPIAARFSPATIERGGAETMRDVRGFAVKFYTEEGNYDLVGLNMPMFAIKDPAAFSSLFHALKRNPATNLFDLTMLWDYVTYHPETAFILLLFFGDRGIPDGYRHMPGYSIHTLVVYNAEGVRSYIRIHVEPVAGIKNLNSTQGMKLAGSQPDYCTRDLYEAIGRGEYPKWNVSFQILSEEDVKNAEFDIFDPTNILPEDLYPLHPVGVITLDKNPLNYFAEIEQIAFCPSNLIPGMLGGADTLYRARRFAYKDAQRYRLGSNFDNIEVNCPFQRNTYIRDGVPPVKNNGKNSPNYTPNSFNGPVPYHDDNVPKLPKITEGESTNLKQATDWYLNNMSSGERGRFVENIVGALCPVPEFLKDRVIGLFKRVHPSLADKVTKGLKECKVMN